jgi:hypothetical protein
MPLGHRSDGSSVQKHSAGSNYPYVVGKQEGAEQPWFVMAPNGSEARFTTGKVAYDYAIAAANIYNH